MRGERREVTHGVRNALNDSQAPDLTVNPTTPKHSEQSQGVPRGKGLQFRTSARLCTASWHTSSLILREEGLICINSLLFTGLVWAPIKPGLQECWKQSRCSTRTVLHRNNLYFCIDISLAMMILKCHFHRSQVRFKPLCTNSGF